MNIILKR